MIDTLLLILQKIFMLCAFIMIGYFLKRKNIIPKESAKTLSYLGTNVIYPAYLIKNLSSSFTRETFDENLPLFLWGLVFLGCTIVVGYLCALFFKKSDVPKNTFIYIFSFSNYGYFGYPVIEGVFGQEILAKTIVFAIPSSIAIGSIGYFLLMGKGKGIKKTLLSPNIIALVVGCVFGLLGVKIPYSSETITVGSTVMGFLSDTLVAASNCMSAVTMLLTGFVLGKFSLKELFKSPLSYIVSFVRLALIAVICATILYFSGVRGLLFILPVIICAMPVGMNTVLFTEAGGRDSSESARICFVSNIMGIITIPIVFAFLSNFI